MPSSSLPRVVIPPPSGPCRRSFHTHTTLNTSDDVHQGRKRTKRKYHQHQDLGLAVDYDLEAAAQASKRAHETSKRLSMLEKQRKSKELGSRWYNLRDAERTDDPVAVARARIRKKRRQDSTRAQRENEQERRNRWYNKVEHTHDGQRLAKKHARDILRNMKLEKRKRQVQVEQLKKQKLDAMEQLASQSRAQLKRSLPDKPQQPLKQPAFKPGPYLNNTESSYGANGPATSRRVFQTHQELVLEEQVVEEWHRTVKRKRRAKSQPSVPRKKRGASNKERGETKENDIDISHPCSTEFVQPTPSDGIGRELPTQTNTSPKIPGEAPSLKAATAEITVATSEAPHKTSTKPALVAESFEHPHSREASNADTSTQESHEDTSSQESHEDTTDHTHTQ